MNRLGEDTPLPKGSVHSSKMDASRTRSPNDGSTSPRFGASLDYTAQQQSTRQAPLLATTSFKSFS